MLRKVITHITYPVLIAALLLCLAAVAYAAGNIDPTNKWAWGTNVGWLNFNDANGGVTVYADHLEGYAWGENIGWIRLGSHSGGGSHTYANSTKDDYGVNRDANGNLSGYAWGTNVGWINFDPTHSQVTIDPATGSFDGYAWAENIGWIHFQGTGAVAYNVVTTFRTIGPLLPATLPNGTVGTAYNQTFTASGGTEPYTFAVTAGTLPPGLTLDPNGQLHGTPTTAGTFNFTVTATDANGNTGSQAYTITVNLLLSPATLPNGMVGTAYNQTLTASGGSGAYTFAVTAGSLPPGLTLDPNGQLHGTPTTAGTFTFTVTATDASGNTGSQTYTITIAKPAPVGGYLLPVNRLDLLAPWLVLAAVALAAATVAAVALRRRRRI